MWHKVIVGLGLQHDSALSDCTALPRTRAATCKETTLSQAKACQAFFYVANYVNGNLDTQSAVRPNLVVVQCL